MRLQENRGGGTVCTRGPPAAISLWSSFTISIAGVEACWEYNPCAGSSTQCYWCDTGSPTLKPTPAPSGVPAPTQTFAPSLFVGENVSVGEIALIVFNSGEESLDLTSLDTSLDLLHPPCSNMVWSGLN
jgi:hypothetical protein